MADNRLAYGLAKAYGIDTTGMSPREVWDALAEEGVTSQNAELKQAEKAMEAVDAEKVASQRSKPEPAVGFANKERKNTRHHIQHAKQMGFKNQAEYEQAAKDFFNGNEGTVFFSKARSVFIATMRKPVDWQRQAMVSYILL